MPKRIRTDPMKPLSLLLAVLLAFPMLASCASEGAALTESVEVTAEQAELPQTEPETVWERIEKLDYLLIGDSRVAQLRNLDVLTDSGRNLGVNGATIRNFEQQLTDVINREPEVIFCSYGVNDCASGLWDTPEDWAEEYTGILTDLHEALPDAYIFVSALLPVTADALKNNPEWEQIPAYSAVLQAVCDSLENVTYLPSCDLTDMDSSLFLSDGIHFQDEVYPIWLEEFANAADEILNK